MGIKKQAIGNGPLLELGNGSELRLELPNGLERCVLLHEVFGTSVCHGGNTELQVELLGWNQPTLIGVRDEKEQKNNHADFE